MSIAYDGIMTRTRLADHIVWDGVVKREHFVILSRGGPPGSVLIVCRAADRARIDMIVEPRRPAGVLVVYVNATLAQIEATRAAEELRFEGGALYLKSEGLL